MQTFEMSTRLCFGEHALDGLKTLGATRVLIVTDDFFEKNGEAARIGRLFEAEAVELFARVQPDPSLTLAMEGAEVLRRFQPDTVAALGGGSAIDCAKAMLALAGGDARLIAIPTTSGTGSEVTAFSILTHEGVKHPLIDEALRPRAAFLDASLLTQLPRALIADAGMDVVAHCLEASAAKNASPFSDAFALYALRTVLEALPASFGGDRTVRQAVHCAATMAGIAFDSAGLGACHALSHALGGRFHIAHGRLNGILLPYVLRFNAEACPTVYRRCAAYCGVSGVHGLILAVERLRRSLELPSTLRQAGLREAEVREAEDAICEAAAKDPCAETNPRPLSPDALRGLLREAL